MTRMFPQVFSTVVETVAFVALSISNPRAVERLSEDDAHQIAVEAYLYFTRSSCASR